MVRLLVVIVVIIAAAGAAVGLWYKSAGEGVSPATLEAKYMTGADRFVQIAGVRVRVREEGSSDAPVIVLLHGYTHSLETWDAWAEELAKTHRVIRYDLLGHGLTGPDPKKRYAPAERAAFLRDVFDALNVEKASVAGNSLGGLIAWRFAADNPERVEKLILVDAAAYSINGVTDEPVPIPPAMDVFLRTAPEAGVAATVAFVYADDSKIRPERVEALRDMMRRKGNGQAFVDHIAEFTLPDPSADLARIAAPTLILWGREDALIPVAQGEMLEDAIPDARLIIYDGAGHAPQEEIPEQSVSDALAFLAGAQ